MAPHVQQINVKPDIQGEVGLPKMPINTANVTFSGIDGDYNRFRKKKKDNDPDMAIMIISTDILKRDPFRHGLWIHRTRTAIQDRRCHPRNFIYL